jgi:ADP-ribose pyrophosphatase YjhB (NUDIX family)
VSAYTLVVEDGKILLCRLSGMTTASGHWTLPGGGLERGETTEQAAVRETLEETGLCVVLGEKLKLDIEEFNFIDGRMRAERHIYAVRSFTGELAHETENSTDRCEWFMFEEARALPLVSLAKLGIRLAKRYNPIE